MAVFVGREDALTTFQQTMECLKPQNALVSFFNKKDDIKSKQIFLFDGEGGFGKTTLTTQCLKIAKEVCKQNYKVVRLDFQDYFLKQGFKEKNSRTIISALYTHLTKDDQLKLKHHFLKYEEILQKVEKVEEKVKDVKKEEGFSDTLSDLATEGIIALADSQFAGVSTLAKGITKQVSKMGIDKTGEYINAKLEKKLLKEELDLYRNSDKVLTDKLAEGLVEASQAQPIILVLDTFEEIDNTDIDSWLFTSFFKAIYQQETANKVIIIITGRKNHKEDYKNAGLDTDLLYHKTLKAFSQEEVQKFAEQESITLSEEQVKKITKFTSGIPLVLENALQYLKEQPTNQYNAFINELQRHQGNSTTIFTGLVERFLRYSTDEIEKERLYYLAFLPELDTNILAKVWDCSEQQAILIIDDLAMKHSFIDSEGKLHNMVAEHLRKHLANSKKLKGLAEAYTKKLADAYKAILDDYREKWRVEECYEDEGFCKTVLHHLSALLWKHDDEAFTYLPAYWLEAFEFNVGLGIQLFSIPFELKDEATGKERMVKNHGLLHSFEPYLQDRYKQETKLYQDASKFLVMFLFMRRERELHIFSEKGLQPFRKLIDKFSTQSVKYHFTPFQLQLLQLRLGEYYCFTKQEEKAFQTLSEMIVFGIEALDKVVGYYFGVIGTLYNETKSYEKVVTCFLKAVEKEEWGSYVNLGSFYTKFWKDYSKATSYYEKALEKEDWKGYLGLGILYQYIFKDYAKAKEYYEKALEKEEWGAYLNLGILYTDIFKDYTKAQEFYEQALEKEEWETYVNLGVLYQDVLKDYSKAKEFYEKALEKEVWGAYVNLGNLYAKGWKNYSKAQECYEKALEKEEWWAYPNLANLHYFEEDLPAKGLKVAQEGITKIQTLQEKEPKNEDYWAILAGLHTVGENKGAFYTCLSKAVEYGYAPSDDIEKYPQSVQRYFHEEAFQALIQKGKEPLV